MRFRKYVPFILILLLGGSATAAAPANLAYYTGQEQKLQLEAPPATVSKTVPLKGKSSYGEVMVRVLTPKREAAVHLRPGKDKKFAADFLISDGPGEYLFQMFGASSPEARQYTGILEFRVQATESYSAGDPALNMGDEIVSYLTKREGKKIGRGECWDAAQEALDVNGAIWKRTMDFGRQINPDKEDVQPGDIIQFRTVKIVVDETLEDGSRVRMQMAIGNPDHTSIVTKVLGPMHFEVIHQNVNGKRFMVFDELDFSKGKITGSIRFFRPRAGLKFK